MRTLLALPLALALIAACAVPARENPNDPANKPEVTISISPLDGSPHTDFTIVATSRPSNVTRTLDLDGDGVFETSMPDATWTGELLLPVSVFGSSGVGSVIRTVGIEVHDGASRAATSAEVRVSNSAPAIDLGSEIVTAAWEQSTVELHPCGERIECETPDPDGSEGLEYSWRQLSGTPVLPAAVLDSVASFVAPLAPETLVFELTVDDGFTSVRQPLHVRVGHPAWVVSAEPPRLYRLFPDARRVELTAHPPMITATTTNEGDTWMIKGTYQSDDWEAARVSATGDILGRWPIEPSVGGQEIGGAGPVFGEGDLGGWALVGVDLLSGYQQQLWRLEPILAGTAGTAVVVDPGFTPVRIAPDPLLAGGVFVVGIGLAAHVGPDGIPGASFPIGGWEHLCAANDGSIWSTSMGFVPGTDAPLTYLHKLLPDDTFTTLTLEGRAAGLVPGSQGVLVAFKDGAFLESILPVPDVDVLSLQAQPAPSVNVESAQLVGNGDGDLWIYHLVEATMRRLSSRSGAFEEAAMATLEQLGLDPSPVTQPGPFIAADSWNGGVLVSAGSAPGHAMFVRIPANASPLEQALSILPGRVATDPTRGAYWTPAEIDVSQVRHVKRFDSRGRVLGALGIPDEFVSNVITGASDGSVLVTTNVNDFSDTRVRRYTRAGTPIGTPVDIIGERVLSIGLDATGAIRCRGSLLTNGDNRLSRDGIEFASGPQQTNEPGVSLTRSGACWGWLSDGTVAYADATGSQIVNFPDGAEAIVADPYDESAWAYDSNTQTIHHLSAPDGTVLDSFPTPALLGPGGVFGRFRMTRACDPAVEAGSPACRELWMTDTANPGTVYRMNGFGDVVSSFPLSAGTAEFLDVR